MSDEDRWLGIKRTLGDKRIAFGPVLGDWYVRSPRRFLQQMACYKFAAKMIGPGRRVLDVACGEGLGTWVLAVENGSAHGFDPDAAAVAQACKNFDDPRVTFTCADFRATALAAYDAVVAFDVIHRAEPGRFWSVLTACLPHDGVAVVGAANHGPGQRLAHDMGQHFHHVFLFAAHDEVVHTGPADQAAYLIAVGCRKKG